MKPLTELFKKEDVVACACGSTAFFDWCVQIIAKRSYGTPRSQHFADHQNARICIECHRPVVVFDGEAYDASMFVSAEQITALIKLKRVERVRGPIATPDF